MDLDDPGLVSALDEVPLWSAPFGRRLLERVRLRPGITVLDLGCGTGFPLLEIAQRLGPAGRTVGVDPWTAALARAREKARTFGADRAHLVAAVGERLPLPDAGVDLVVSNNGLNNVQDPPAVLAECYRVCRPGAQLVATMNLPETMALFYEAFAATLAELGLRERVAALERHIHEKRKPPEETEALLRAAGFAIESAERDEFVWRFLDGRALFRHFVIRLGFLPAWASVVGEADAPRVLAALEKRLDDVAAARGELALAIPFVCFDCRKA
jgi:ubiquinone/menaquinone biosynthesis C-methylase UbiE